MTTIIESPNEIVASIRSKPNTPRRCSLKRETLQEVRDKVHDHVRNTYLKQINAPVDAPDPALRCWMELN